MVIVTSSWPKVFECDEFEYSWMVMMILFRLVERLLIYVPNYKNKSKISTTLKLMVMRAIIPGKRQEHQQLTTRFASNNWVNPPNLHPTIERPRERENNSKRLSK